MTGAEFIRGVRKAARKNAVAVGFVPRRGKGSHGRLYHGDRFTIVKDRRAEVGPGLLAKLALYQALRDAGISRAALARRLGLSEGAVRRLLDLDHRSHIGQVETALCTLGKRLVLEVRDAA